MLAAVIQLRSPGVLADADIGLAVASMPQWASKQTDVCSKPVLSVIAKLLPKSNIRVLETWPGSFLSLDSDV